MTKKVKSMTGEPGGEKPRQSLKKAREETRVAWGLVMALVMAPVMAVILVTVNAQLQRRETGLEAQRQRVEALSITLQELEGEKAALEREKELLEEALMRRIRQVNQLLKEQEMLEQENEALKTIRATITGYAPLDPAAIAGQCYSGDPRVTATGTQTRVGVAAADLRRVPPGTRLEVPGYGTAVVEDTGGAMRQATDLQIDLVFATRAEALHWGRRQLEIKVVL